MNRGERYGGKLGKGAFAIAVAPWRPAVVTDEIGKRPGRHGSRQLHTETIATHIAVKAIPWRVHPRSERRKAKKAYITVHSTHMYMTVRSEGERHMQATVYPHTNTDDGQPPGQTR